MYFVYILENKSNKSWYIGYTTDIRRRLIEHNTKIGGEYTKKFQWTLIYLEGYLNKFDAIGREKYLKSGAGHRFLKKQLKNYLS